MERETGKTKRKLRADSIRNRERLLEAATEIFSTGGPQASLEAVARGYCLTAQSRRVKSATMFPRRIVAHARRHLLFAGYH
jgi:hypothetical protein